MMEFSIWYGKTNLRDYQEEERNGIKFNINYVIK